MKRSSLYFFFALRWDHNLKFQIILPRIKNTKKKKGLETIESISHFQYWPSKVLFKIIGVRKYESNTIIVTKYDKDTRQDDDYIIWRIHKKKEKKEKKVYSSLNILFKVILFSYQPNKLKWSCEYLDDLAYRAEKDR